MRSVLALVLVVQAGAAWAGTDFGVRQAPGPVAAASQPGKLTLTPIGQAGPRASNLAAAARLGAQWGRVTSTLRSAQHNRRVGGVRNSYHLIGRAIDIARRPGVRHHDIAAAYRAAGYVLVESLDEGDHSHFAFGTGYVPTMPAQQVAGGPAPKWKVIFAPR